MGRALAGLKGTMGKVALEPECGFLNEQGQDVVQRVREQSGQVLPKGLLNAPRALCRWQSLGQRCRPAQGKAHQCLGVWPDPHQMPPAGLGSVPVDLSLLEEEQDLHPAREERPHPPRGVSPHQDVSVPLKEPEVLPARVLSPPVVLDLLWGLLQGLSARLASWPRIPGLLLEV